MVSSQEWKLSTGTARTFPASDYLVKPVILAAKGGTGATDLTAFKAGVDHTSYPFLAKLHARGYDLILVGYNDGNASLYDQARAVTEAVMKASVERQGNAPLAVGGIGRGALAARYALARMEREGIHHDAAQYFSYNGTAPSQGEETTELEQLGWWPNMPIKLGLASGDFTSELILEPLPDSDFDDTKAGAANPGGPLITNELGTWLLDQMDRR